jgi:hypothetical protein
LKDPSLAKSPAISIDATEHSDQQAATSSTSATPLIVKHLIPDWQLLRSPEYNRRVHTVIAGIRIQVSGVKGAKKARETKSFGNFGFPDYFSLIDYGTATKFDKKGSTGVKVWIRSIPVVFKQEKRIKEESAPEKLSE